MKLPLAKLCAVPLALQNRAILEGTKGRKGAEKRAGRGVASKGAKRKKRRVKFCRSIVRSSEKGAFARGALRKLVAHRAPDLRKIA